MKERVNTVVADTYYNSMITFDHRLFGGQAACEYQEFAGFHFTPREILPKLWTPSGEMGLVWYLGPVCYSEDEQDYLGFISDDTTGIEYIVFFDPETRKIVRAVSGLGKNDIGKFDDEDIDGEGTTMMKSEIFHHKVVHTFDQADFDIP